MTERILTTRELNRTLLERQLLRERAPLDPLQLIERMVGMQAQWPSAPYVGVWTRLRSFARTELEELLQSGAVLKATVMRQTLHLVSVRDYGLMRAMMSSNDGYAWQHPAAVRLAPAIRALAADGPLTNALGIELAQRELGLEGEEASRAWHGARIRAHVLHHHDTALWGASPAGRFAAVPEPDVHDALQARAEIVLRYLRAFGPASMADIDAWSMLRQPYIRPAVAHLERTVGLRRFRSESGRELLDAPDAPLLEADAAAPVRLLPKWDNALLAWADRTRIVPEPYRKLVVRRNGEVVQTFLVDGFVAGTWAVKDGRVVTEPFARISREAARELRAEAALLERFIAA